MTRDSTTIAPRANTIRRERTREATVRSKSKPSATSVILVIVAVIILVIAAILCPALLPVYSFLSTVGVILGGLAKVCGKGALGTRLRLRGGGELYYTSAVTKGEACAVALLLYLRLGKYPGAVQLTRQGDIFQLRICLTRGAEQNEKCVAVWKEFAAALAASLAAKPTPIEVHLCNNRLRARRVIDAS